MDQSSPPPLAAQPQGKRASVGAAGISSEPCRHSRDLRHTSHLPGLGPGLTDFCFMTVLSFVKT